MKLHYVYYAIQKDGKPKVGATQNPSERKEVKKYQEIKLLEAYECPWKTGDREIELQIQYFGKRDNNHHYANMIKYSSKGGTMGRIAQNKLGLNAHKGEKNFHAQITNKDVKFIRKHFYKTKNQFGKVPKGYYTCKELSNMFNVSMGIIRRVANKDTWKHIQ